MPYHTIEMNYDYRIRKILQKIKEDYTEEIGNRNFDGWLWQNKEVLGEYLHKDIGDFFGSAEEAIKDED